MLDLEKVFTDYVSKRYYDFFHTIGPANSVQSTALLNKMGADEANSIIDAAEKIGMWHPDTIAMNRRTINK